MVWNVTDPSATETAANGAASAVGGRATAHNSLSSSANSLRPISTTSSSLDLGPTPGSGVGLDSQSEDFLESDSETDTLPLSVVSQGSLTRGDSVESQIPVNSNHEALTVNNVRSLDDHIETGTDTLQWSQDIESMLNNPPPDTFQSFHLAAEPSLSSWVVPSYAQDQLNIDKQGHTTRPYQVDFGRKKSRSRSRSLKGANGTKAALRRDSIQENAVTTSTSHSPNKDWSVSEDLNGRKESSPSPNGTAMLSTKEQTPSSESGSTAELEPLEDFTQLISGGT